MRINNNMMAMNTHRQLGAANANGAKSMEKLSSGFRINRAGDDAAGLSISEKMRGQIRGLNQASSNAQDGISLIQTAEGALNETHAILQRMRELAVQSASDTNVETDRNEIQKEMNQLTSEINRIGNTTEFNTMKLVNGDRAINHADKTIVSDKTYNISSATGITGTLKGVGDVTIAATDEFDWITTSNVQGENTITITKDGDKLTVDIAAKDAAGNELTVTDAFLTVNDDGSHEYNGHGVSFKVSAEDFAAMTDGADLTIDLADAKGAADATGVISTKNDWTKNTENGGALSTAEITGGIKIDGSKMMEGADSFKVELDTTGRNYTVTIFDKDNNALSTDNVTLAAAGDLKYNNHGISFDLTRGDAEELELTVKLDTEQVKGAVESDDSLSFQVGANENQSMSLDIGDMRASALGISSGAGGQGFATGKSVTDGTDNTAAEYSLDVSSHKSAAASVTTINNAIEMVSAERSKLGAVQNRLEHTIKNLDTSAENLQASESRIRDVDMAKEMMEQTKNNILAQASTAMLAQANQAPQSVLQLLG